MNATGQWKKNRLTEQTLAEVGLSEFAAICGLTESEFSKRLFEKLKEGEFLDLIKPESQADFFSWASALKLQDENREFVIRMRLSLNRPDDVALYCLCRRDMTGVEPRIKVLKTIPGVTSIVPDEIKTQLGFEVGFCDFDTAMGE